MNSSTWLRDHLIRKGVITERGVSRRARPRICLRCGLVALVGLDDERCALEVHADPVPLSTLGEALALIEGRRTLALHHEAARFVLDVREADHIADRPAGATAREDVLRQHRCGTGPPAGPLAAASSFAETTPPLPPNSPPPF